MPIPDGGRNCAWTFSSLTRAINAALLLLALGGTRNYRWFRRKLKLVREYRDEPANRCDDQRLMAASGCIWLR